MKRKIKDRIEVTCMVIDTVVAVITLIILIVR